MQSKKSIFLLFLLGFVQPVFSRAPQSAMPVFIPNHRQWDDLVLFQAEIKGGKLFLEQNAATFVYLDQQDLAALHPSRHMKTPEAVHAHALRVSFQGGTGKATFSGSDASATTYNYFLGNDRSRWASGLKAYREVCAANIYPGIDLLYYSRDGNLKYDWIVRAGISPSVIKMNYAGCEPRLSEDGNLLLELSVGSAKELKPVAYQEVNGERRSIACRYRLKQNVVSFDFPQGYDKKYDLIIDPAIVFSSYTGSLADNWGFTATYDTAGNAISGGNVNAIGYPVTLGAYQLNYAGGGAGGNGWSCDMAIAKFNATGTTLEFATYLGGSDNEEPHSIVVDHNNDIVILGITFSGNYPFTTGAYDSTWAGGGDIVVSKLSPDGTALLGSTYLGGSADDGTNITANFLDQYSLKFNYGDDARGEIICDPNNSYIVSCVSQSSDFPTTSGVLQPAFMGGLQDGVLFKLNDQLTSLAWSTYFGGSKDDACYDILVDGSGNFYVAGGTTSSNLPSTTGAYQVALNGTNVDGFVLHIDSNATAVLQCTYVGTTAYDQTYFVELDNAGSVYVLGQTMGTYPVSQGVYSNANSGQFIQKFDPALGTSVFSTTFGSGTPVPNICPTAFLVDTCQNIYAAGWGRCINYGATYPAGNNNNMPLTADAFQSTTDGCDFYFIILNANATSLLYGTYFGGSVSEEHVDGGTSRFNRSGVVYESVCAGCGGHSDFPTQPGVVSQTNNSINCNNAVIKFDLLLASAQAAAQASPTDSGCAPFDVQFTGSISAGSSSYYWDFGDGSPFGSGLTPVHRYQQPGTYTAALYAFGTCHSDSVFLTIQVDTLPAAAFSYSKEPCQPDVVFTNQSSNSGLFHWDFGDGTSSTLANPVHRYDSSATYLVSLIATPDGICPDTFSVALVYSAQDTTKLFIPNVFTPNGDGKNDDFRIHGIVACSSYRCEVFNRWGRKLFESSESVLYWDGKTGDSDAAEGVYYYLVEVDGQEYHGHVSLLRK